MECTKKRARGLFGMIETYGVYVRLFGRWIEMVEFSVRENAEKYRQILVKSYGEENVKIVDERVYETLEEAVVEGDKNE